MERAFWDTMRWDYFRWDVYRDDWERLKKTFEGIGSCDLTRRELSLGARDSSTGWRAKSYTETTIEAVFIPNSSSHLALKAGTYVRSAALLLTADGLQEGDEIKTANNEYYEVKGVRERWLGVNFSYRECDLTLLPLHE